MGADVGTAHRLLPSIPNHTDPRRWGQQVRNLPSTAFRQLAEFLFGSVRVRAKSHAPPSGSDIRGDVTAQSVCVQ